MAQPSRLATKKPYQPDLPTINSIDVNQHGGVPIFSIGADVYLALLRYAWAEYKRRQCGRKHIDQFQRG